LDICKNDFKYYFDRIFNDKAVFNSFSFLCDLENIENIKVFMEKIFIMNNVTVLLSVLSIEKACFNKAVISALDALH
jgi:hypothetical protein